MVEVKAEQVALKLRTWVTTAEVKTGKPSSLLATNPAGAIDNIQVEPPVMSWPEAIGTAVVTPVNVPLNTDVVNWLLGLIVKVGVIVVVIVELEVIVVVAVDVEVNTDDMVDVDKPPIVVVVVVDVVLVVVKNLSKSGKSGNPIVRKKYGKFSGFGVHLILLNVWLS